MSEVHECLRKSGRALKIVELFQRGMNNSDIAKSAVCSERYVRKVLAANRIRATAAQPPQRKWYDKIANDDFASIRAAILAPAARKETIQSTNLLNPGNVRDITEAEIKANTLPHSLYSNDPSEIKRCQAYVRHHLSGEKKGSLGFLLVDAHSPPEHESEKGSNDVTQLLSLIDTNGRYKKILHPIFQTLQAGRQQDANGDKMRLQAKMSDLAALAEVRVKAATDQVKRLKRMEIAASRRAAQNVLRKAKRRAGLVGVFDAPIRKKAKRNVKTAPTLESARQVLCDVQAEFKTIDETIDYMCKGFERIRKVRHVLRYLQFAVNDCRQAANA